MKTFKIILSIFFIILGIGCFYLILSLRTVDYINRDLSISFNDGVAVGYGIISGLSFLSSTLLLNSFGGRKE